MTPTLPGSTAFCTARVNTGIVMPSPIPMTTMLRRTVAYVVCASIIAISTMPSAVAATPVTATLR